MSSDLNFELYEPPVTRVNALILSDAANIETTSVNRMRLFMALVVFFLGLFVNALWLGSAFLIFALLLR